MKPDEMNNWTNEILLNQLDKEPKSIFNAYCEELGKYYSKMGFKFFKSRPRIERQNKDIIESINFWSSRNNVKNENVHLEILPYVKSKSLKKWIKTNQIGRNEFIYSIKVDYPRSLGILGHSFKEFTKLIKEIDSNIISRFEEFNLAISDSKKILETEKIDKSIIVDNFLAYLCMNNPELINEGLKKYGDRISKELQSKIMEKKEAS